MSIPRKTHCAIHGVARRVTVVDESKGWVCTWCPRCAAERRRKHRAQVREQRDHTPALSALYRLAIGRWA